MACKGNCECKKDPVEKIRSSGELVIKTKQLHPDAKLPVYKNDGDAGADVCCLEAIILRPHERRMCPLGFSMEIPDGYEIQVRSRSGLAMHQGIIVLNSPGTVDSGYRGEAKVILINLDDSCVTLAKGSRIAQFVVKPVEQAVFEIVSEISDSERGESGFGSTGV